MARVTGCREAIPLPVFSTSDHAENWWHNKSLVERNAYMLEKEIEADVTFIFNTKEEYTKGDVSAAHKDKAPNDEDEFVDCPTSNANSPSIGLSDTNDSIHTSNNSSFEASTSSTSRSGVHHPEMNEVTVSAHRYMLLSASSVFWALVSGVHDHDEVKIEDVDVQTFRLMLRFIYTDDTDINDQTVIQLLNASKKYDLSTLTERCTTWLSNHVTPESACVLLQKSMELNQEKLCLQCLKIIQNHTDTAFESAGFGDISQDALSYILNSDMLSIKEVQVFHYCSVWATNKLMKCGESLSGAKVREKLGPILYKIRFPTLSMDDFTSIIVPTNVLSKEDELSIFRCLSMGAGSQCDIAFVATPRRMPEVPKPPPLALPMPPPREECMELVPIDVEETTEDDSDEETQPKVIWSSKSPTKPPPPSSRYLQISKPDVGRLKQQHCVPPTEFEVTVCAIEDAFLVNGFTIGAPVLNDVGSSTSDQASPNMDLPFLSIINLTCHQPLLLQHSIQSHEVKIQDGVAFVNIKTTPFWLLPKESTKIHVIYNIDETAEGKRGNSIFKKVLNYASKAIKTNHYSCKVQTLPGLYLLMNNGEKKIQMSGSPSSPIMGLLYESP